MRTWTVEETQDEHEGHVQQRLVAWIDGRQVLEAGGQTWTQTAEAVALTAGQKRPLRSRVLVRTERCALSAAATGRGPAALGRPGDLKESCPGQCPVDDRRRGRAGGRISLRGERRAEHDDATRAAGGPGVGAGPGADDQVRGGAATSAGAVLVPGERCGLPGAVRGGRRAARPVGQPTRRACPLGWRDCCPRPNKRPGCGWSWIARTS